MPAGGMSFLEKLIALVFARDADDVPCHASKFYFGPKECHNLAVQDNEYTHLSRMGNVDILNLVSHLVIYMVVLLLAISCHEAGHAWMSYKFGDDTAYMLGRVTLNPVAHTDPIGTLLIPIDCVCSRLGRRCAGQHSAHRLGKADAR